VCVVVERFLDTDKVLLLHTHTHTHRDLGCLPACLLLRVYKSSTFSGRQTTAGTHREDGDYKDMDDDDLLSNIQVATPFVVVSFLFLVYKFPTFRDPRNECRQLTLSKTIKYRFFFLNKLNLN
jgi:hypothetical protein